MGVPHHTSFEPFDFLINLLLEFQGNFPLAQPNFVQLQIFQSFYCGREHHRIDQPIQNKNIQCASSNLLPSAQYYKFAASNTMLLRIQFTTFVQPRPTHHSTQVVSYLLPLAALSLLAVLKFLLRLQLLLSAHYASEQLSPYQP